MLFCNRAAHLKASMKTTLRLALGITAACFFVMTSHAEDWPTKPVRIIVPFAPGGITDILARFLAKGIAEDSGQPVIVENRPGAGGNIGSALVAKSAPDGATLLVAAPGNFSINQYMFKSMPYSPERDLTGVTVIAQVPIVLLVNAQVPIHSVQELIAFAKAHPGELNASSGGNGQSSHLSLELFKSITGVNIVHVPFNGAAPARQELLSGRVQLTFDALSSYVPDVKQGSLRVLATGTAQPSRFLPGVPTLAASGVTGYAAGAWYALAVPAGTPRSLVDAINREAVKVLSEPRTVESIEQQSAEVIGSDVDTTHKFFDSESAKWKKIVDISGAKIE